MLKENVRAEASDRVADAVGRLMEFWGFKRTLGRLWGTLFLSPRALPAAELCERLGISAGAASMALSELERWGVVHRRFRPGERREYFEAETNLWKMISRVWEERERREIDLLVEALEAALEAVEDESPATSEEKAEVKFVRHRLQKLLDLARLGRTLFSMLIGGGHPDLEQLKRTSLD